MVKRSSLLYIREHHSYNSGLACKLGHATGSLIAEELSFSLNEIVKGSFTMVVKFDDNYAEKFINDNLQELEAYAIPNDYVIGFYRKGVSGKILELLNNLPSNIAYKMYTPEDIDKAAKAALHQIAIKRANNNLTINISEHSTFIPRASQVTIVNQLTDYFTTHNKGVLLLMCGVGKTLISLWMAKSLRSKSMLIGVPNMLLLRQWETITHSFYKGSSVNITTYFARTKDEAIDKFLKTNADTPYVIITTYQSANRLKNILNKHKAIDLKINDEMHHLTNQHHHSAILDINANIQLSMTASENYYIEDVDTYGEVIIKRGLAWAVAEGLISDYIIDIVTCRASRLTKQNRALKSYDIDKQSMPLFMAAFAAVQSIINKQTTKLLIYANSVESCSRINDYIRAYSEELGVKIYCSTFDSSMPDTTQQTIIGTFKDTSTAILSTTQYLGEGWDMPILDGVVFAELNNTRIMQHAMRSCRILNNWSKKNRIIVPIVLYDSNDQFGLIDVKSTDFQKANIVLQQISKEDDAIGKKVSILQLEPSSKVENGISAQLSKILCKKLIRSIIPYYTLTEALEVTRRNHIKCLEDYFELTDENCRLPEYDKLEEVYHVSNILEYFGITVDDYHPRDVVLKMLIRFRSTRVEMSNNDLIKLLRHEDPKVPHWDMWTFIYGVDVEAIDFDELKGYFEEPLIKL